MEKLIELILEMVVGTSIVITAAVTLFVINKAYKYVKSLFTKEEKVKWVLNK